MPLYFSRTKLYTNLEMWALQECKEIGTYKEIKFEEWIDTFYSNMGSMDVPDEGIPRGMRNPCQNFYLMQHSSIDYLLDQDGGMAKNCGKVKVRDKKTGKFKLENYTRVKKSKWWDFFGKENFSSDEIQRLRKKWGKKNKVYTLFYHFEEGNNILSRKYFNNLQKTYDIKSLFKNIIWHKTIPDNHETFNKAIGAFWKFFPNDDGKYYKRGSLSKLYMKINQFEFHIPQNSDFKGFVWVKNIKHEEIKKNIYKIFIQMIGFSHYIKSKAQINDKVCQPKPSTFEKIEENVSSFKNFFFR